MSERDIEIEGASWERYTPAAAPFGRPGNGRAGEEEEEEKDATSGPSGSSALFSHFFEGRRSRSPRSLSPKVTQTIQEEI